MNVGNAAAGTGLAGSMVNEVVAALAAALGSDFDEDVARVALEPVCDGLALAIVTHITDHAALHGVTAGADTVAPPGAIT